MTNRREEHDNDDGGLSGLMPLGPIDRRPVPDPTVLTTEAIKREGEAVRRAIDADYAAHKTLIENKFQMIERQFDKLEAVRVELKADHVRELDSWQAAQDADRQRISAASDEHMARLRHEIEEAVSAWHRELNSVITDHRNLTDAKLGALKENSDLSTAQRDEALVRLRETHHEALERVRDLTFQQLAALRKELELVATQREIDANKSIDQLRILMESKLSAVHKQIEMGDRQRDEQKRDAEAAIQTARTAAQTNLSDFMVRYNAAHQELFGQTQNALELFRANVEEKFSAARELVTQQAEAADKAISKSEGAMSKQLEQMQDRISDLKESITELRAIKIGATENRSDSRANIGTYVAVAGLLLTIIAMVLMNTSHIVMGH